MINCIYSKRYPFCGIYVHAEPVTLSFLRTPSTIMTDEEFVESAIQFSEKESVGLDIFESEDRLCADFFIGTVFVSDEKTGIFERLFAASTMFEIIVSEEHSPTVVMRFGREKHNSDK